MKQTSIYPVVFLALVLALFTRVFFISVYKIPTNSMSPTLLAGDFILGSQVAYGLKFPWSREVWFKSFPKRGDLVAVSFANRPSVTYLRRVTGVAGDFVEINQQKIQIGVNQVFVKSDNSEFKEDSHDFGLVSVEQIESRAWLLWFSLSTEKQIRWERIGQFL